MQKFQLLLIAILGLGFLVSCEKVEGNTEKVTYEKDISLLFTSCANQYCHGAREVNFIGYENVVNSINDGRVLGALRQDEGFKAMPFGNEVEGKWPSEDIQLLEEWIENGMPQ